MKPNDSRYAWIWGVAFAVVWCLLRVFWLTCDTGIPSTWEYGFHTTDEGYYLGGGKEMLLWGSFVDVVRRETLNYCYSYGTHWLSYLAHVLFGLSTWTWRLPFVFLYFVAWMMVYCHAARKAGGWFAFATCASVASLPLIVTYERGGSNDAVIAALLAIAYVIAAGRGRWRIFAAAFVTSLIATVKPSVWVLAPIVLSGLLEERKTRSRLLDAALFCVFVVVGTGTWKCLSAVSVVGEAGRAGMSPFAVLKEVNATYGLPSITDILLDFRAIASFPRDSSVRIMGATTPLISAVPAGMFLVLLARRRWNCHLLLYGGVAAYAYALNVINSMYTHYFLPLLVMLPIVFLAFREDCRDLAFDRTDRNRLLLTLGFGAALLSIAVLMVSSSKFDVRQAAELYSRIHNLPQKNPWRLSWPFVAAGTLAGVAAVAFRRRLDALVREGWMWGGVFFLAASAAFAALPAAVIAAKIHLQPQMFYLPLALNLVVGFLLAYVLFATPAAFSQRPFAAAALVVPILASYLLLPTWRSAAVELVTRRTFCNRDTAKDLARLVPPDAIVLGERSNQAFMSIPVRTATLFNFNSDPIPLIEKIWARDPAANLYGFFDAQHAYCLQHLHEHADKYRLLLVKEFSMPSFANGSPAKVYLCRIVPTRRKPAP